MKLKKRNIGDTAILIDAAYLSRIAKHLGNGKYLKYNIQTLAINLAKTYCLWCQDIYYYTAPPFQSAIPTKEEAEKKSKYDKFIRKIQSKLPTTWVREGRCQFINGIYKQKGVDNLLTQDLIKIAQRKQFESIIIITADTDFAPILESIRKEYGLKIILAYYTDRKRNSSFSMSNHLWNVCDKKILMKKDYFFIPESKS
ncbi:MAG: NYN domain-containing protein [Nanoarchaeota archaeon]